MEYDLKPLFSDAQSLFGPGSLASRLLQIRKRAAERYARLRPLSLGPIQQQFCEIVVLRHDREHVSLVFERRMGLRPKVRRPDERQERREDLEAKLAKSPGNRTPRTLCMSRLEEYNRQGIE
jgi:hypothetical protein